MNTIKSLLFFAVLFTSCASFAQNKETRKVASFNKIEASGSSDVIIQQGDENSITIEYRGIEAEKIITEVKGETLKVGLEKGSYRNISVTFYITYKKIEAVSNSGSGKMHCKSPFSAITFRLSNSGSGSLRCDGSIKANQISFDMSGSGNAQLTSIETENFELTMSGSGKVKVDSGSASRLALRKSGSGDFEAYGVESDKCSFSMSGSGNVEITANEEIEASMSGSGNISYKGGAVINKIHSSGSGKIKRI